MHLTSLLRVFQQCFSAVFVCWILQKVMLSKIHKTNLNSVPLLHVSVILNCSKHRVHPNKMQHKVLSLATALQINQPLISHFANLSAISASSMGGGS